MKVLIVRDREASGGGVHNYYRAIDSHLSIDHEFLDVGRPHAFYSSDQSHSDGYFATAIRLMQDWARLLRRLCTLPDLIHLNPCLDPKEMRSLPRDAVNLLMAKLFRRGVLVFWRGWDNEVCGSPHFPGGNGGWLSRVYRMADVNIVLSARFRHDLLNWGFSSPIFVETTVVADSLLEPVGAQLKQRKLECCRILFLSRIEVAKGVFEMLRAFALLESRAPGRFGLTIAGDGPDLKEVKRVAGESGMSGIEFKGYVDEAAKSVCFREADIFCFLSYTEGMPNAVLEAMAMGLPLVSSAAGGLMDILEDGLNGYLVSYDSRAEPGHRFSEDDVATRIERLSQDEACRGRMADRNRRQAAEKYAAGVVAGRLEKIYRYMNGNDSEDETSTVNLLKSHEWKPTSRL